ncbi:hypothetical protein D8X55_01000 [Malacoplasma penetrans]|uniref:Uncharacterized protein n=1 Tax=Malacoplasma penetrans (strain HF-2) TaxID=272633 RepID=Q8EVT7_MALP2|nr:hypothetical protein [Malacoplasma penetrans]RXY97262.1 hypothetical protein D8X55_01000 [Malacoplasma penetrans]BAC44262.1 hypothetical protein [Malacoplasma penetrans HF-2]
MPKMKIKKIKFSYFINYTNRLFKSSNISKLVSLIESIKKKFTRVKQLFIKQTYKIETYQLAKNFYDNSVNTKMEVNYGSKQ